MGERGPTPKRSDQRRRRNKPPESGPQETTKAPAGAAEPPDRPPADESWHELAIEWYESLATSGQSRFYEPSDWALARIIAESISQEFKPRPIIVAGVVKRIKQPPRATALAQWLKAMTALLATEGDRRRAAMELQRPKPEGEDGGAGVSSLDDARHRLGLGGAG